MMRTHYSALMRLPWLPLLSFIFCSSIVASRANAAERFMEENFLLRNWDTEDGLPGSRITAMAQTSDGYLWFGTQNGLARFDGIRFVIFSRSNTPALSNNFISCLLTDREGTLWIGTKSSLLLKYNNAGFTTVDLGLPSTAVINWLMQDKDGVIWIATQGNGVFRLSGSDKKNYAGKEGLPTSIWRMVCDANGHVWATDGKLRLFENGMWHIVGDATPWLSRINAIGSSHDNGLWLGTLMDGSRVFKLEDGHAETNFDSYAPSSDTQRSRADVLLEDHSHRLWVGTYGEGVFCRSSGQPWQRLTFESGLDQAVVESMMEDSQGCLWIGTRANGIFRVRPRPVTTLRLFDEPRSGFFLTTCVGSDGSLWSGTDGNGIYRWQNGVLTRYGPAQGVTNPQVGVLFEDHQKTLWAGTWGGLLRFNGEKFESVSGPLGPGRAVLALFEDSRSNLWVGTWQGVVRMRGNEVQVFGNKEGVTSSYIRAIVEDREGRIWLAGANAGLFRQNGNAFELYGAGHWNGAKAIRALHVDADGVMWIATYGAYFTRFKDGQFEQFTSGDGVPNDHLQAVIEDNNGWLWFSSDDGIFGCDRHVLANYDRKKDPPPVFRRLSRSDGLPFKICSGAGQPTAIKSADGKLFFPDGAALAIFHPENLPQPPPVYPPLIEEVLVDGAAKKTANHQLSVKSGAQRIEIHFTSPATLFPENVRFRSMMENLDHDWVDSGANRETIYNRLGPGRYNFRVSARIGDGKWTESPSGLNIEIFPRLWERTEVQILMGGVLLFGFGFTGWRIERNRTRRRLERLEFQRAMDNERQRIARDIHDDLGTGLTQIIMAGTHLSHDATLSPTSRTWVQDIAARARNLTRSMDEVVWAINPRNDTLESLITYLNKSAQDALSLAGIRCRWDFPEELPDMPLSAEARHNLFLACKEAVHNIIKHAGASEVWIRLKLGEGIFTLIIEDNGTGFDPDVSRESGNGLPNMHKRMEECGGQCRIESESGSTRIQFSLRPDTNAIQPPRHFWL
jgi:ligand-binding sensor domain-containing protein/signal transduction histidine kinase